MENFFKHKNLFLSFIILTFFIFFFKLCYKKIPIRFWDEHDWIAKSYYFDLFVKGDFNNELWFTIDSYDQPKLTEYLYGLAIYPYYLNYKKNKEVDFIEFLIDHNFYKVSSLKYKNYKSKKVDFVEWGKNPKEVFDVSPDYLIKKFGKNIQKTIDLIFAARRINIFILSFNVLVVYFLSFILSNSSFISFLTALFFGTNILVVSASLRAQSDGLFLFLFNICLLFLVLFFRKNRYPFKIGLLFFIFSAFLNATKINGVMMVFIFDLLVIIVLIYNYIFKNKIVYRLLKTLIVGNFLFIFLFIAHHYLLLKLPIKGTILLYKHRQQQALHQARYELPDTALWTFKDRLKALYTNFFSTEGVRNFNNYYPIKNLIDKHHRFFSKFFLITFILGFIVFVIKKGEEFWFFILTFIFLIIITGFYLLLNWDRYLLSFYFFIIFHYFILIESCLKGNKGEINKHSR